MNGDSLERAARKVVQQVLDAQMLCSTSTSAVRKAWPIVADFARDRLDAQRKEIVAEIRKEADAHEGRQYVNSAEIVLRKLADAIEGGKKPSTKRDERLSRPSSFGAGSIFDE